MNACKGREISVNRICVCVWLLGVHQAPTVYFTYLLCQVVVPLETLHVKSHPLDCRKAPAPG